MPTFDTPEPIFATVTLAHGAVRLTASDRADTTVEVRPTNPSTAADVKAAEETRVEYAHGRLLVSGPEPRRFGRVGSIDLTIEAPTGSHLHADAAAADFTCTGRLGECTVKTASGNIQLEHTGELHATAASGNIAVDHAAGRTEVSTASGDVRIREIDGAAQIKNTNGNSRVGEVTGELRMNAANGDLAVDRAHADVNARTVNGNVRIGEVVRGSVNLEAAAGNLEVGIRSGTAAWLDVSSLVGGVRNLLDATDEPGSTEDKVEVRARTMTGNITVRRA